MLEEKMEVIRRVDGGQLLPVVPDDPRPDHSSRQYRLHIYTSLHNKYDINLRI
jgi:hypothetical protein